jgi:hypothetical protein
VQRRSDLGTKWLSPALTRVAARIKQSGQARMANYAQKPPAKGLV